MTTTLLTSNNIVRVYTARREGCRCGCKGKYYYPAIPETLVLGAARRGYDIALEEINDRKVAEVLSQINAHLDCAERNDEYEPYINYTAPTGHVFTAYLKHS